MGFSDERRVREVRGYGPFRRLDPRHQFPLHLQDSPNPPVSESQRLHHPALGNIFGTGLDHHDGILGTGDHEIQDRPVEIGEGRKEHEAVIDQTHADRGDSRVEREIRNGERGRRPGNREHVRIVGAVAGKEQTGDLGITPPALRKQRAKRPIDQPAGENLLLVRPSLAFEETSRNASRRIEVLPVVHGKRQEIHIRAIVFRGRYGGQYDRVSHTDRDRSRRLPSQFAGLDDQLAPADSCADLFHHLRFLLPFLACRPAFRSSTRPFVSPFPGWPVRVLRSPGLLPETEFPDQAAIPPHVLAPEVTEQPPPSAHHLEQASTGRMVLAVLTEMAGKASDPRRQERNLHFRRPRIRLVEAELLDDLPSLSLRECQE